jgi:hypothetical protein
MIRRMARKILARAMSKPKRRIALASNGTLCDTGLANRFHFFLGFPRPALLRQIHIPDAGINVYLFTYC